MKTLYPKYLRTLLQVYRKWQWRRRRIKQFRVMILGKRKRILMCENDYWRLHKALAQEKRKGSINRRLLKDFRLILKRAEVHAIKLIPNNVVTMNSEIALLTGQGKAVNVKLVYPDETDRTKGYVSIFSWTGMCLIGKTEGDCVRHNICVHKVVYQR